MEKWIEGDILIPFWWSSKFNNFDYIYDAVNKVTKLRWSNGTVKTCEYVYVVFVARGKKIRHKYIPRWSFDGNPYGIAGAALSHDFDILNNQVTMSIENAPIDGGPATVGIIQVGPSETVFAPEDLNWDNLNHIPWSVTMNDIPLDMGQSMMLPTFPVPPTSKAIVYRATIWLDSDPTNVVEYTGQFTEEDLGTTQ